MKANMKRMLQIIRKYPLSILCIVLIWYLSLFFIPPEELDLSQISFADKWTHLVMYGGTCSVIWWEYLCRHTTLNYQKLFLWAWFAPILMSGLLELLQAYCTTNRAGEWLDLAANATGCTIGAIIGLAMRRAYKQE